MATFGSFQSPSVEQLVSLSDDEYKSPMIPFEVPDVKLNTFGSDLFCIEPKWTFINHGAFGAAFKKSIEVAAMFTKRMEAQPLRFIDRELLPLLVDATRKLAKFVGTAPTNLVLTNNVTLGLNAVFKSLSMSSNGSQNVLRLDLAYGSVKKMLNFYNFKVTEVIVPLPVSNSALIKQVHEILKSKVFSIVVLDHITSNSAIKLPLEELIPLCKSFGSKVVIDGAHALGALNLNLDLLRPDFYVSNAHKWLCNPKGAAFLYVAKELQSIMKPLIVSHGNGVGFLSDFIWTGSQDYCNLLTIPYTLSIWEYLGPQKIRNHISELLNSAIDILLKAWKTETLAEKCMYVSMATIRLPGSMTAAHDDEHNEIQNILYSKYKIEVPIKKFGNVLYVRISAHIYNKKDDYINLANAMLQIRPNSLKSRI